MPYIESEDASRIYYETFGHESLYPIILIHPTVSIRNPCLYIKIKKSYLGYTITLFGIYIIMFIVSKLHANVNRRERILIGKGFS